MIATPVLQSHLKIGLDALLHRCKNASRILLLLGLRLLGLMNASLVRLVSKIESLILLLAVTGFPFTMTVLSALVLSIVPLDLLILSGPLLFRMTAWVGQTTALCDLCRLVIATCGQMTVSLPVGLLTLLQALLQSLGTILDLIGPLPRRQPGTIELLLLERSRESAT